MGWMVKSSPPTVTGMTHAYQKIHYSAGDEQDWNGPAISANSDVCLNTSKKMKEKYHANPYNI